MWMEEGLRLRDKYELFCRTVTASIRMCSKEEFAGHGRGCVSVWIPYLEGWKQFDLLDMRITVRLSQWGYAWLSGTAPIFSTFCPCYTLRCLFMPECVHACSDLKSRAVFLCRDLAWGSMCLEQMNTTRLWFASSLFTRLQILCSPLFLLFLSTYWSRALQVWYLKSSPQFTLGFCSARVCCWK